MLNVWKSALLTSTKILGKHGDGFNMFFPSFGMYRYSSWHNNNNDANKFKNKLLLLLIMIVNFVKLWFRDKKFVLAFQTALGEIYKTP